MHAHIHTNGRTYSLHGTRKSYCSFCWFRLDFCLDFGGKKKKKEKEESKGKPTKPPIHVDRKLALLKLRDVASTGLREVLWSDEEVQKVLLWSLEDSQPELAQILTLAVFVHLTSSARNCEALLLCEEVRSRLVRVVQESSGEVREKALLALTGLAVASFQKEEFEDVRNLLGQAAGRGRGAAQRIEVFRALWSAAVVCESPELFFGNTRIWGSLCESIEPTEPADVRESALGLLGALTWQPTGPHFVWHDAASREHLFTNTLRSQPSTVRTRALVALAGIAREPEMRAPIWAYVSVDLTRRLTEDDEEEEPHAFRKRNRAGSKATSESEEKAQEEEERPSMKDSLLAAASRTEICTVRSSALRVLLEISFGEDFMLELVESGLADLLLEASHDQRLQQKERKLCLHGQNRIREWNEARLAEELRIERENESRERLAMRLEEEYQAHHMWYSARRQSHGCIFRRFLGEQMLAPEVIAMKVTRRHRAKQPGKLQKGSVPKSEEMKRADEESYAFEEWSKAQIEIKAMAKADESSAAMNRHLKFLLDMNRERMEQEDELSLQFRQQEEKRVFASKVAAARERAIEAAKAAAGAMKRVGGDAILQARDAGEAAGAAAAKLGMGPLIQATFAGAQAAAAASAKQKQPLTRSEQLDEANKAALVVADRCDMTEDEIQLIDEATIAAKEAARLDEQSDIATCFAVALACRLSLTEEAQSAVTGGETAVAADSHLTYTSFPHVLGFNICSRPYSAQHILYCIQYTNIPYIYNMLYV
ncbi:unnamed protein product [Symbiodinium sp. CCMP2456]|nr:unnamed protein product [Symbiodinium sp. CCMP2456]